MPIERDCDKATVWVQTDGGKLTILQRNLMYKMRKVTMRMCFVCVEGRCENGFPFVPHVFFLHFIIVTSPHECPSLPGLSTLQVSMETPN